MPSSPNSQLTPRQIFRLFDSGALSREQLRDALSHHALELIDEMEDAWRHPQATWLEGAINKLQAARLSRAHGEPIVREILLAISEVPDFPPARYLWNADHLDVPLHCFLRSRREPLFRVLKIISAPFVLEVVVEHGRKAALHRERFKLQRDRSGRLAVSERQREG